MVGSVATRRHPARSLIGRGRSASARRRRASGSAPAPGAGSGHQSGRHPGGMAIRSGATETRGRRPGMTVVRAMPSMLPSASRTRQAATRRRPLGVCSTPFDAPGYGGSKYRPLRRWMTSTPTPRRRARRSSRVASQSAGTGPRVLLAACRPNTVVTARRRACAPRCSSTDRRSTRARWSGRRRAAHHRAMPAVPARAVRPSAELPPRHAAARPVWGCPEHRSGPQQRAPHRR